jgi:hypothetical protein
MECNANVGADDDMEREAERVLFARPGIVGSSRTEFSAVDGFLGIVGGMNVPVKSSPVIKGCSLAW